jgi:predicted Zn finger-like uncharacterized protein
MAKCPGCGAFTSFRIEKQQLGGTAFDYNLVVCAMCQTAIGVVGIYNTDTQLLELRDAIRAIATKMGIAVQLSTD